MKNAEFNIPSGLYSQSISVPFKFKELNNRNCSYCIYFRKSACLHVPCLISNISLIYIPQKDRTI